MTATITRSVPNPAHVFGSKAMPVHIREIRVETALASRDLEKVRQALLTRLIALVAVAGVRKVLGRDLTTVLTTPISERLSTGSILNKGAAIREIELIVNQVEASIALEERRTAASYAILKLERWRPNCLTQAEIILVDTELTIGTLPSERLIAVIEKIELLVIQRRAQIAATGGRKAKTAPPKAGKNGWHAAR